MKDIVSLNRHFLLLARNAAQDSAGTLFTGLPSATLEKLKSLSLDQVDALASALPVSAFTCRFNESEIDRMVGGMKASNAPAYAISVLAGPMRQ